MAEPTRTHAFDTIPPWFSNNAAYSKDALLAWLQVDSGLLAVIDLQVLPGSVRVFLTDATQVPAVVGSLDAFNPGGVEAVAPVLRDARQHVLDVRQVVTAVEAIPSGDRTPEQTGILRTARLLLDVVGYLWKDADQGGTP